MSFLSNLLGRGKEAPPSRDLLALLELLSEPVRVSQELPRRIGLCEKALNLTDRTRQPKLWSALHNTLGKSLIENPLGNRADNLEQAIQHFQQALEVRTRAALPQDWAESQSNLAAVYLYRIRGERADNLEQAIDHCQQALEIYTRYAFPKYWAGIQVNLAVSYLYRIRGERADNLEQAIEHCRQALEVYTRAAFSERWAMTQNNLAIAYADRIRGDRADNLEQAISHYQQALEVRTCDAFPEDWAMTQNNLANAYLHRIRGERADNLEQAIDRCQQALEVYTRAAFPEMWAMAQNNLALAYADRIRGERADNLEQAIRHYQQALEVRTRDAFPEDWAATQNNLALAFSNRIRGERADNLEHAIDYCEQALKVRTRDAFPEDWAATQNNLALAYADRIRGDRAVNLEHAISHYQQALEVRTRQAFPEMWAMTQHNLAIAYRNRIFGERTDNLEQAIRYSLQALEVYTQTAFPEDWAKTQNDLALAYSDRIRGERADNLEQAIHYYQQALEVLTQAAFPEKWAAGQNNLANAYHDRLRGERADNLEHAIRHYQQALNVYTRAAFPANHLQCQRNLGNLHFNERHWPEALTAYQQAIEVGNDLLVSAYSVAGRQAEVSESAHIYSRAAYCLLQVGQPDKAFVLLERGKTRLLAEALALDNLDIKFLSEQQRTPLQAARSALKTLEAEMQLPSDTPARRDDRTLVDLIRTQRTELNALIDAIRRDHPGFMPLGLELADILELIPVDGALVAPLFTAQGSAVFVVPHGTTDVTFAHVVALDELKDDDVNTMLHGNDEQPGWLHAYENYYNTHHLGNWQTSIELLTGRLWQVLIEPIYTRLSALGVRSLLLLPSGGLQLLPLHAAWRLDQHGQPRTLLEDYEIMYAPSAYAMSMAQRRAAGRAAGTALVAGINAYRGLSPLHSAVAEAAAVANALHTEPLLDSAATKEAVKAGAPDVAYLHLCCHSSFSWLAPMYSAIYLANDEPLRLFEIIGELDLRSARLITLSACETGVSEVRQSPDEYIGLPAGFMQAGAPAVISSLWTVDDRSTALLMERVYRNHIEHHMTCSAALREAQLWLRNATRQELGDYYKSFLRMSASDAFAGFMELSLESGGKPEDRPCANPFYWAAFTFNGASE